MDKMLEEVSKNKKSIFASLAFFIAVFVGFFYLYQTFFGYYILIRFKELGPLTRNMPVYYSGFKVGKVVDISPDKDFKHTMVKVLLTYKDTRLPKNTMVIVQRFPSGENYLEFLYPDMPSLQLLARGDVINGDTDYSLESFMRGQSRFGAGDIVSEKVMTALSSADATNIAMRHFFETSTQVITENRESINRSFQNTEKMTKNLAETAENLNQTSKKLNNSMDQIKLNNTVSNITDTTENIKNTTASINNATKDIDKTVKKLDAAISDIGSTASNMNKMTSGLNATLGKRFGGTRLLFGKPISDSCIKK